MLFSNKRNKLLQETLIEFCDSFKIMMRGTWTPRSFAGMTLPKQQYFIFIFPDEEPAIYFIAWPFHLLCSSQFSVSNYKVPSFFFLLGIGMLPTSLSLCSSTRQNTPIWDYSLAGAGGGLIGSTSQCFDLFTNYLQSMTFLNGWKMLGKVCNVFNWARLSSLWCLQAP